MDRSIEKRIEDLENRVRVIEDAISSSYSHQKNENRKKLSVREFLNKKKPKGNPNTILALAVYNEQFNEQGYFNVKTISDLMGKAKLKKPENINYPIYINVQKGYFEEDDEKGEDNKKRWHVTQTGISLVDSNFKNDG